MSDVNVETKEVKKSSSKGKKGSSSARKRMSRLMAVQAIYQVLMTDTDVNTILLSTRDKTLRQDPDNLQEYVDHDDALFLSIVRSWQAQQEQITTMIKETIKDKKLVPEKILLATLMAGAAELLSHEEIDAPIIIKDYMNVTESFFEEQGEQKFVNAVLDRIRKAVR
jgi:transcription termination factor NusB